LLKVDKAYADAAMRAQQKRARWLQVFARAAHPRNARGLVLVTLLLFAASVWYSSDRLVGTLQAGAPELRADSRYNLDAK
ncbi:hypothetical protein ABTH30_24190, partial [Acinetobacter baumannii]